MHQVTRLLPGPNGELVEGLKTMHSVPGMSLHRFRVFFSAFPSFLLLLLFEKFLHVGLLLLLQTFSGILVN
jgi:hypothetical protein